MSRSMGINCGHYYNRGDHNCVPLQGMYQDDLFQRISA